MFYPTTCVRLRYGYHKDMLSGFSREYGYPRYQPLPKEAPYYQVLPKKTLYFQVRL